jgi:hypothetical protein
MVSVVLPQIRLCFNLGAILSLQWEYPGAKQVNASASIHGALERLQSVDLALRLPIAPGFEHGIANLFDAMT